MDEIQPHNATITSPKMNFTSFDGIRYSMFVMLYLCVRDVLKYAIPLVKLYISKQLKID